MQMLVTYLGGLACMQGEKGERRTSASRAKGRCSPQPFLPPTGQRDSREHEATYQSKKKKGLACSLHTRVELMRAATRKERREKGGQVGASRAKGRCSPQPFLPPTGQRDSREHEATYQSKKKKGLACSLHTRVELMRAATRSQRTKERASKQGVATTRSQGVDASKTMRGCCERRVTKRVLRTQTDLLLTGEGCCNRTERVVERGERERKERKERVAGCCNNEKRGR
jgi:predicted nucleic acid-binding protein